MTSSPVVGVIGRDVPLEMIDAVGAVPRMLRGVPDADTAFAEEVLGAGVDPAGHHLLGALLANQFAGLDAVVCCSDSDLSLRLFYALRELARRRPAVPPVHLVDILHLRRTASLEYDLKQLRAFQTVLSEWTGTAPSDEDLAEAIRRRSQVRAELRRLAERRTTEGSDAFTAVRRRVDEVSASDAHDIVTAAIAEPPSERVHDGLPVILTGSADLGSGTAAALESLGLAVVGDDLADGEAGLEFEASPATLDALARRLRDDAGTPHRASAPERGRLLAERVAERRARAVVAVVRRRDDAPLWDLAEQRERAGVPLVVLRDQGFGELDREALSSALDTTEAAL